MAIPTAEFWKLLGESRLINPARLPQLQAGFAGVKGSQNSDNSRTLAEWLISENAITRYQAKVILAGRAGPFFYGDYCLREKCDSGRLKGRFRAVHAPTGHPVVLEFLSGPVTKDKELWLAAAKNAERVRTIVMPGYCRLYELMDLTTFKFAVMENVRGDTLDRYLSGGASLPPEEACRIARLIALAFSQMHQMGHAYGELRPENVLLTPEGGIKLLCPPLAYDLTKTAGSFSWTQNDPDGRTLKMADYIAPEQAPAGSRPSPGTDLYSLGCLLYRMTTGQEPFAGGTVAEKVQRHATQPIVPLTSYGIPEALSQVVTYMMAKNPSVRFQNANQLVDALAPFVPEQKRNPPRTAPSETLDSFEQTLQQRRASLLQKAQQIEIIPDMQTSYVRGSSSGAAAVPVLKTDGSSPTGSTVALGRRKKSGTGMWVGVAGGILGVLVVAGLVMSLTNGNDPYIKDPVAKVDPKDNNELPDEREDIEAGNKTNQTSSLLPSTADSREKAIPDNGRALWMSPTVGPPLNLKYLPPGAQIFLAVRPAELFHGPEGDKIMAAIGPAGQGFLNKLKETTAFDSSEIEQVLMGIESSPEGVVDASLVVYLKDAMPRAALLKVWDNPTEAGEPGDPYFVGNGHAYYIPSGEESRVFAVSSKEKIEEVIEFSGAAPPLRREMEEMLEDTYASRHFTLLFAPNFLFGDGKKGLFSGMSAPLEKPLFDFLGSNQIKAGIFSFHVGEDFFAELRLGGQLDLPPTELAEQIHGRMSEIPGQFRRLLLELNPPEYAANLLADFPEYVRLLSSYTRSGTAHDQAVLRSYLPAGAGQYLMMGSELTMALLGGSGGPVAVASAEPAEPQTVEEKLEQKASLSFPRDTLEVSLQLLSKELDTEIIIIGADLQLDGITKNQSFGIDLRDKSGKEILTEILRLANPDKTATGAADPKQKLVYVIKPKEEGGEKAVFVTTRAQAEKRKDELPSEFQVKE